jgi:hypothetical protein
MNNTYFHQTRSKISYGVSKNQTVPTSQVLSQTRKRTRVMKLKLLVPKCTQNQTAFLRMA